MKHNRNIIKRHIKILGIGASLFKTELCPREILFLSKKCAHTVVYIEAENGFTITVWVIMKNRKCLRIIFNSCIGIVFVKHNLTGLCEAINAVFPKTKNQLCIVHQIRNSCKFVPYNDRKAVCADLKKIYGAVNLDDAEYAKEEFREKWDKKYPNILKSWDKNWAELTTFFEYPEEIRKIIYTTNAVEGYHRMVRKFTKSKSIFPTDGLCEKNSVQTINRRKMTLW